MLKTKLVRGFLAVLLMSLTLSLFNFIENGKISPIKEAQAEHCVTPEIEAGTTGSITMTMQGPFASTCKVVVISNSSSNAIVFDSQFQGIVTCSNGASVGEYATENFDATGVTGITSPTTISVTIVANFDSGGECEEIQGSGEIVIVPAGWYSQGFNLGCSPPSATVVAGGSTAFSLSTTAIGSFNSPVAFSASISPSSGVVPTISFTNNNQIPSATTTANVTTTTSTTPATYTITFTGTGGSSTNNCNVTLIINSAGPIIGTGATQLAVYETPSVLLQVSGSSSATIQTGQSAVLSWVTTATNSGNSCTATDTWSGSKPSDPGVTYLESVGPFGTVGTYTYIISCAGALSSVSPPSSVTITVVSAPPPSFAINCSPLTVTIAPGDTTSYSLSTTPINGHNDPITFVLAAINPSKGILPTVSFLNNGQVSPNTTTAVVSTAVNTTPTTYTLTFEGTDGILLEGCDVELVIDPVPGSAPNTPLVTASNTTCGVINLSWVPGSIPPPQTGFRVFHSTSSTTGPWTEITDSSPRPLPASTTSFVHDSTKTPPPIAIGNYYRVVVYNSSVPAVDDQNRNITGPINLNPCQSSMTLSDKDIISVGTIANPTSVYTNSSVSPCNGQHDVIPEDKIFKQGDVVTYQINVCNSGDTDFTNVEIEDTMENLLIVPGSFQYGLLPDGTSCKKASEQFNLNGDPFKFKLFLTDIRKPDVTAFPPETAIPCSVTFQSIATAPSTLSALYSFRNTAVVGAAGPVTANLLGPYYPFGLGAGIINRTETSP